MSKYLVMSAQVSDCGRYRYTLTRTWAIGGEILVYAMLNPSKADALIDDHTILRCVGLAQAKKYSGLIAVNMYPYRATSPKDLEEFIKTVSTSEYIEMDRRNYEVIAQSIFRRDLVLAWGADPLATSWRAEKIRAIWAARENEVGAVYRFGELTHKRQPRHPLYVKNDVEWQVIAPRKEVAR
jgi:hypothetical protein